VEIIGLSIHTGTSTALANPPYPSKAPRPEPSSATGTGLRPYGLSVLTTLAAMAVTRITWPFFSGAPFAPLFAAVAATTHFGSGPAGLLAVVLGALGAPLALPMYGTRPWNPYTLIGFIPVALIG